MELQKSSQSKYYHLVDDRPQYQHMHQMRTETVTGALQHFPCMCVVSGQHVWIVGVTVTDVESDSGVEPALSLDEGAVRFDVLWLLQKDTSLKKDSSKLNRMNEEYVTLSCTLPSLDGCSVFLVFFCWVKQQCVSNQSWWFFSVRLVAYFYRWDRKWKMSVTASYETRSRSH